MNIFCQVCLTTELSCDSTDSDIQLPKPPSPTTEFHSDTISVDPDKILLESYQTKFRTLTQTYNDVFDTKIQGYNGSMGPFEAWFWFDFCFTALRHILGHFGRGQLT